MLYTSVYTFSNRGEKPVSPAPTYPTSPNCAQAPKDVTPPSCHPYCVERACVCLLHHHNQT